MHFMQPGGTIKDQVEANTCAPMGTLSQPRAYGTEHQPTEAHGMRM